MRLWKVVSFLFSIWVTFTVAPAHVQASDMYEELTEEAEARTVELFGDEATAAILRFKNEVERASYKATLRLCPLYRQWKGLPKVVSHHGSEEYAASGIKSWLKILKEGATQPLSAVFGMKGDYLELTQTNLSSPETWFGSLYTLYLINSWGFLDAASHCLNTVSANDIHDFASAVLLADMSGTVATEFIVGHSIGSVFKYIGRGIKGLWLSFKTRFLPKSLVLSLGRYKLNRTHVTLAVMPFGHAWIERKREMEKQEMELKNWVEQFLSEVEDEQEQ